jgi:replicative DNA helicase
LADLRESGAIEQDSDLVMFIYRPTYHQERSGKEEDMAANFDETVATLIIAKNRNGPTGIIKLAFIKPWTRFESYLER